MPLFFIGPFPRTGFADPVFTFLYFFDCRRFILISRWLPTKRCGASNFKKSVRVANSLAKYLTFVILRINDFLTTLSIIVAAIITRYYFFKKGVSQKEKLIAKPT